jgi:hypothetical protein
MNEEILNKIKTYKELIKSFYKKYPIITAFIAGISTGLLISWVF